MKLPALSSYTARCIADGELAGAVALVEQNGKRIHEEAQGFQNLAAKIPMKMDTIFRIHSMTKPVTAFAAMMLIDQKHMILETPLSEFIPAFKQTKVYVSGKSPNFITRNPDREIQIRDLLSHTSGLTYEFSYRHEVDARYRELGMNAFSNTLSLADLCDRLAQCPLLYSPGQHWSYSYSHDVLGRIIEIISGQSLGEFFKSQLFEPLGMKDTDFYLPAEKQDRLAVFYKIEESPRRLIVIDQAPESLCLQKPAAELGGTGLVSTAEDFSQFCKMLLNAGEFKGHRFMSRSTFDQMVTPVLPRNIHADSFSPAGDYVPNGRSYALGFGVVVSPEQEQLPAKVGTFGWNGSAHTKFFVDPKSKLIAIWLTQLYPPDYRLNMLNEIDQAIYQDLPDSSG